MAQARGTSAILATAGPGLDAPFLESELAELASQSRDPRKMIQMGRNALTEQAKSLISESIILAAEQMVKAATEASQRHLDDAEDQHRRVVEWGKAKLEEARKTAETIAESHAIMIRSAEHFKNAMNPPEESREIR